MAMWARLLDIAIQFSRGLHYAHENGVAMKNLARISDRNRRDALKRALITESKGTLVLRDDKEAAYLSSQADPLYSNDGKYILRGVELINRRTGDLITECDFAGGDWDSLEKEIVYRAFLMKAAMFW